MKSPKVRSKLLFIVAAALLMSTVSLIGGEHRRRCGTVKTWHKVTRATDCGPQSSTIKSEYDPGDVFNIPVVIHVLYRTDGIGRISLAQARSQIDILNEDFRALSGSAGASGFDTGIQFVLATTDPMGQATQGITFTENDTWFEDESEEIRKQFGAALQWDPRRYLNIFVNSGGGALGYVDNMPWMEGADPDFEGVVVAFDAFGRDSDDPLYNQGRTATHEVGHYLGLEHTFGFDGDCGGGDCYREGDLLCDTASHDQPNEACTDDMMCSTPDPIHNYMNYTPDACMSEFTAEQGNRMRCSILTYRSDLIEVEQKTATRWLPHLTRRDGGFETRLHFTNRSASPVKLDLYLYDAQGRLLGDRMLSFDSGAFRSAEAGQLFGNLVGSHFSIEGPEACLVTAAYRSTQAGATAHVHETSHSGSRFMIYLGEKEHVFDGLAVVNIGDQPADIQMIPVDEEGRNGAVQTLVRDLPSHGKWLNTFDAFEDEHAILIQSDQPVVPVFLRGTRPGVSPAYLYQTQAISMD